MQSLLRNKQYSISLSWSAISDSPRRLLALQVKKHAVCRCSRGCICGNPPARALVQSSRSMLQLRSVRAGDLIKAGWLKNLQQGYSAMHIIS
jgi:hypothetical protein